MAAVEDFFERYNGRDWERLAECFSPEQFHRVGPFGDRIDSAAEYLAFLRRVVPTLGPNYQLILERAVYADGTAVAEVIEHYEIDGDLRRTPEAMIFDLDGAGRIVGLRLYLQRPGEEAPVGGHGAMGAAEE